MYVLFTPLRELCNTFFDKFKRFIGLIYTYIIIIKKEMSTRERVMYIQRWRKCEFGVEVEKTSDAGVGT